MMKTIARLAAIASLALLGACASQPPGPPKTINLIVFPGGWNWPVWVAQEKGLFARNGVVMITLTPVGADLKWLKALVEAGIEKARLLQKIKDFKSGAKPATIMQQIAKGYSDEQMDLIASYYAAQK